MGKKRIMFTGGSGKAGRHVVQYLVDKGHQVLNIDTKPLDNPKVRTLIADITDSGQVFNALHQLYGPARIRPVAARAAGRRGGAFRRRSRAS